MHLPSCIFRQALTISKPHGRHHCIPDHASLVQLGRGLSQVPGFSCLLDAAGQRGDVGRPFHSL